MSSVHHSFTSLFFFFNTTKQPALRYSMLMNSVMEHEKATDSFMMRKAAVVLVNHARSFRAKRAQPSAFSKRLRAMWGAMAMSVCVNQLSLPYYQRRWDYVPYYQPLLASDYKCEREQICRRPNWRKRKRACCSAVIWCSKERWTNSTAPEWFMWVIDNRARQLKYSSSLNSLRSSLENLKSFWPTENITRPISILWGERGDYYLL